MIRDQIFKEIDALTPAYLDLWEEITAIESPTLCKAGVDAVGQRLADAAVALGFRVERLPLEGAGDVVVITMNADAPAAPICLSGHMDTVHAKGSFGTPVAYRDEEKLYGPGATDCKGGLVAGLLAMDALARVGYTARPVMLLLQSDEEMGSRPSARQSIDYICERAKGARAFFNLEGGASDWVALSRKGILTFTFTVKGQAAHASLCATAGANAILDAAHRIIECERLKDANGITCSCGTVTGGTVVNAVAEECVFRVDTRFTTAAEREEVITRMQRIADTEYVPGCTCTVTHGRGRIAMELCERNERLLADINRIYEAEGMPTLLGRMSTGGSDAAEVTAAGIPCLDNFGVIGRHIHSTREYGYIDSLSLAAKRLAVAAYSL